jgi:hypothetical protein
MEELASFPYGDNDDLVDSTSQALIRYRQGGFIGIDSAMKRMKSGTSKAAEPNGITQFKDVKMATSSMDKGLYAATAGS